jgi:hypothetical protein
MKTYFYLSVKRLFTAIGVRPQNFSDKTKDYLRETLLPISYCTLYTLYRFKGFWTQVSV